MPRLTFRSRRRNGGEPHTSIRSWMGLLVAIVLLTGCDRRVATCDHRSEVSELRQLRLPRAEADAISAYRSGDRRLLGVYRYALEVPAYRGDFYAHPGMVRALAGTGDAYCDDQERQLNANAWAYAERYNEAMLKLAGSASTAN